MNTKDQKGTWVVLYVKQLQMTVTAEPLHAGRVPAPISKTVAIAANMYCILSRTQHVLDYATQKVGMRAVECQAGTEPNGCFSTTSNIHSLGPTS